MWESTAVPELREQAARLGDGLERALITDAASDAHLVTNAHLFEEIPQ